MLTAETGAMPLLWLMLATAILAIASILVVIRREVQLGLR
ncbi:Bcr/CflA family drug resistance efflux transporter, partial [Cribrihabitans sp. XS_ASV171]